jgi:nucleosome assembly protein 1-like 1
LDLQLKLKAGSGFVLEFIFEPNDYFSNPVLTKEYFIRFSVDDENPLGYEGPDITKCTGCTIDWKPGKNVTVRVVKKVQKHKNRGTKRTVTQTVKNDSFFNFFDPPKVEDDEEPDEDTEALLTADFEIGHYLRENIIPRAVLYFTGEALDDDEDYDAEEGEEDDDDDDEDEEEGSDGETHPSSTTHHQHHKHNKGKKSQNPEECKQQ